ncbi:hypothetical protein COY87_04060 [Candidatus Roizmanbacteria bacterium CG_4_10_14_0_8_um_filter_33_9]|uniref:Glutamyl-tRNA amidotransferase n=1 Tax=Candidatus Roizmanbacteria bacterium CG_4_10_14_0_8_um_filter_33_9 TaxID=1974826 RepID=A0A2M7QIH8_9BACT|nr:MAG: hypothetical protein COY87_04060 [Candidatus Roizmanbacteria bacterium CG_4_10_14_0_8_um_filter_33_9]
MLRQQIQTELIIALKTKQTNLLNTLRYIVAQIKNKEIDKHSELNDNEIISVLQKIKKELQESIDSYTKGKRKDLISESSEQMKIVLSYLPKELSDEELKAAIQKLIQKNDALFKQNPKLIIGICIKELKTQADPSRIMTILKQIAQV